MAKVIVGEPTLVYSPPVNEATSKWGVYAIPKMWREPNGDLVVRFNGEEDSGLTRQCVPNLYFKSVDNGNSWQAVPGGDAIYDMSLVAGINPPYTHLADGDIIALRSKKCLPITGVEHIKEYIQPCKASLIHVYKYCDIPDECKGAELIRIKNGKTTAEDIYMDFPEREIGVNAKGLENGEYLPLPEYVMSNLFWTPYMTGITELSDGTLVALSHGQHPDVYDRQCEEVYLTASSDGGKTWKKRGVVASDNDELPFGYGGDGAEMSIARCENGDLLCVMRMEASTLEHYFCDAVLARSEDNGYTWSKPKSVADSSVTPHVVALKDAVVLIYGRPGVHAKVSFDNGKTWSEPYRIVGNTLDEERRLGKTDAKAKYLDMRSYSNTFVEKISENSLLVLYNDLKYDDGDGLHHKAAFVRKITITED